MKAETYTRLAASEVGVTVRPYAERSLHSLLYLKAHLEQDGELVPTDLLAAIGSKGVPV